MSTLRTILAATDFSPPSRHAAERAAHLASDHGATLHLVHTLGATALDDLRRWLGDADTTCDTLEAEAREQLRALAADLAQRHGGAIVETLVPGHPVDAVTLEAQRLDPELLVTGTRGAGFFRGVVFGATAERIARRSQRPVLMVREPAHVPYRRVLVPVDFSPWSLSAVELALRTVPQATLVLMHALELPYERKLRLAGVADTVVARYRNEARREAEERLRQLAAASRLPADRVQFATPEGADPWMLVVQQEQERECDLIVIGKHGRHALEELLLGSTTRMVIAEGHADVLVSPVHRD